MGSNEQLVEFITKSRQMGRLDDQIMQTLLSARWRKDQIESAFAYIKDQKQREIKDMEISESEIPDKEGETLPSQVAQPQAKQPSPALQQPSQPVEQEPAPAQQQSSQPAAFQKQPYQQKPPEIQPQLQPTQKPSPPAQQPPQEQPQQPAQAKGEAPPEKKGLNIKFILIALGALLLLLALGAAAYFFFFTQQPSDQAANGQGAGEAQQDGQASPQQAGDEGVQVKISEQNTSKAQRDCGSDDGCFAEASKNCEPAKVVSKKSIDLFGMVSTSSSYMETRAAEQGKCIFYTRIEDSSVGFSPEMVSALVASGTHPDTIRKQEEEAARSARLAIGMDGTCKFKTNDLAAMLLRWQSGEYSSKDYSVAECSGRLFERPGGNFSFNFSNSSEVGAGNSNATAANSTGQQKQNTPPTAPIATPPIAQANNSSQQAKNTTNASAQAWKSKSFLRVERYTSFFPEKLSWFCPARGGEFYRAFYRDYYGGGCISESGMQGYKDIEEVEQNCNPTIPCCYSSGPHQSKSTQILYFECGFDFPATN